MSWRRLGRARLLWGSLTIALLPAAMALVGVGMGRWGAGLFHEALEVYFRLVLPLAPVLMVAQAVAEELDLNTHTYLFARPAPRAAIVLGKWATATLALLPSFLVGVGLAFVAAVVVPAATNAQVRTSDITTALGTLGPALAAVALGVPVYCGVAAGVGTLLVRRPMLAGFLYILVVEDLFATLPGFVKVLAVSFYLRTLAGLPPDHSAALMRVWEPEPGAAASTLLALVIGGLWLALAMWLVKGAEYREAA
jgi:hypothetical protein